MASASTGTRETQHQAVKTEALLREALRPKLLDILCTEGVLDAELAQRMLKWRHSGFSVHNWVTTPTIRGPREDSSRMVLTRPGQSILAKRERIKKRTIAKRRLHYQRHAA